MRTYGNTGSAVAGRAPADDDEFAGLRTRASQRDVVTDIDRAHAVRSPIPPPAPAPDPVWRTSCEIPAARPRAQQPPTAAAAPAAPSRGAGAQRNAQRIRDAGTTPAQIRVWAAENDVPCPARGVVPGHVIDAYVQTKGTSRKAQLDGPPAEGQAHEAPQVVAPRPGGRRRVPKGAAPPAPGRAPHGRDVADWQPLLRPVATALRALADALDALPTTTTAPGTGS